VAGKGLRSVALVGSSVTNDGELVSGGERSFGKEDDVSTCCLAQLVCMVRRSVVFALGDVV
jgi:hypothetical protein